MKIRSTNFSTTQIVILVIALVTGIYICAKAQVVLSGQSNLGGYTTMNVNPLGAVVKITSGNPPNCTNGCVYSFQVTATGGRTPYAFSAVGLPTGLTINQTTGLITGNPTVNSTYNGTINVQDFNGIMAQPLNFTIVISAGAPALKITSGSLTGIVGTVGQVFPTYTGTASGGTLPYTWNINSGTLPGGLSLANSANTGIISGTYTTAGSFSGNLRVTDNVAAFVDLPFSFTVNPTPPPCNVTVSPLSLSLVTGGTQQFTATVTNCSSSTVTWSVNGVNGGNSTTGTVTTQGLFVAPANVPSPPTVTVTATSTADVTKSGSASVVIQSTTQGENTYCLKGDVSQFAGDGLAAGWNDCVYTNLDGWLSNGTVRTVTDNASFTTAVNAAVCGDIIQVTAGTNLNGPITFPANFGSTCGPNNVITVRTSGYVSLPPEHTRVTPCAFGVSSLPDYPPDNIIGQGLAAIFTCSSITNNGFKITAQAANNGQALVLGNNQKWTRFIGMEVTKPTGFFTQGALIIHGDPNDHIVFDRVWCHGTQHDETTRCIGESSMSHTAWINSFFSDFHCESNKGTCGDSQAIAGGINPNNLETESAIKVYNNFISSAGEGTEWGGGVANVITHNMEFRANWYYKPQTWNPSSTNYTGGGSHGFAWISKNNEEFKQGDEVLSEGNFYQNSWAGFTQNGAHFLLNPKSQANGTANQCPICETVNHTVRYNYGTNSNQAMQVNNGNNDNGAFAFQGNHYSIHDNTWDDLGDPLSCGAAICSGVTTNIGMVGQSTNTAPQSDWLHDVEVYNNTYIFSSSHFTGAPSALITVDGPCVTFDSTGKCTTPATFNYYVANNIGNAGTFGQISAFSGTNKCSNLQGSVSFLLWWQACFVNFTFDGMAVVGGNPAGKNWKWPGTHNNFPTDYPSIGFINYNNGQYGDYHLSNLSPIKGIGVDPITGVANGSDPGANIDLVNLYTAGVTTQTGGSSPIGASPSACAGNGLPTSGCVALFPGFTDTTHTGNGTPLFDPSPNNISTLPMSKWLYTGNTTLFIGEYQPWFCPTGYPANCNGHKNIAMDEHNIAQLTSQLQAMAAHGINAISVDWYGTTGGQVFNDTTTVDIGNIIASGIVPMQLIIVYDQGSFTALCPQGAVDRTVCIENQIIADLDVANSRWFQQSWYTNDANRPLLLYFITESLWSGTNWTTVWSTVTAHIAGYAKKPKQIFRAGSFAHVNEDGEYAWPQPAGTYSTTNQFFWGDNSSTTPNYIDNFLANCLSHSTEVCIPYMAKGFNDLVASWGTGRVTDQQAGNVLFLTGNEITHNNSFGTSNQLKYMQIATMNDYEEGTEIETGVDNTYAVTATLVGASTLNWTTTSGNSKANLRTIAFDQIYYLDALGHYILVKDQLPNTSTTIDLSTLPIPVGQWQVFVVAEGMPYEWNKISNAITYIH